MVDFRKKLKSKQIVKKVHPIDIYNSLDRTSVTGPLRPVQERILKEWYAHRKDDKDLIIKLHTGVGKTLIGLLILQSKINSNEGPCIYVCPNIYLVNQVCQEAKKFGISYCIIDESKELPDDFITGKSILITHAQKIFTGIGATFGIGNASFQVGSIVLDDSHACIDTINGAFSISISKKNNKSLYEDIIQLFEDDLSEQGPGTLLDIKSEDFDSLLPIPYWSWENKKEELLQLLSSNRTSDEIRYAWPLLKDDISKCKAFITGRKIEITPYYMPIRKFGTFSGAKNRILMSATTQNDSFFIKGLGFDIEPIKNPLTDAECKWSGEKMILIPSLIHEECDRPNVIGTFGKEMKKSFGIVSLVPSSDKSKIYEKYGATVADSTNIFGLISDLKAGEYKNTLVINNRYDGIDLPDASCRVLIIDSLPYFESLNDRYEEMCRGNSEIITRKLAQKIEQGLGRSVRGEKDYSAILIIGSDLVKFMKSMQTNKLFSLQTQKQIEIGIEIAEMAKDDLKSEDSPINAIISLIKQCLKRDDGWKEYYYEEMNSIEEQSNEDDRVYQMLYLEAEAEKANYNGDYHLACEKIQRVIDSIDDNQLEKGWYLQTKARYTYNLSKLESNRYQQVAFNKNSELMKPKEGINYKKIEYINEARTKRIKTYINKFENYKEFNMHVDSILDTLSFGVRADKFEGAFQEIGELLGFNSQRPDKIIRKGPDNLWCVRTNEYIMLECKSEVKADRKEITKDEAGQMNNHCGWFEEEYGDAEVRRILVIPTKNLSYYADFTHDVYIMRKNKLKSLKDNIKGFVKELKKYVIKEISDEKIQELIDFHKLDIDSLNELYCEDYYKKSK